jgi:N6-L-threonylcarbamoyladenine synthase
MTLLAFESSCDETSVAVVRDGVVLATVVSSQIKLHAEYGGVVPELAAREHLRNLLPVARAALDQAGIAPAQIDAVAATRGPGLPVALMVGLKAAQAFAFVTGKPFIGIHHHEAHLFSPWIVSEPTAEGPPRVRSDFAALQPHVSLIVSGGHTMLVHVESDTQYRVLGGTLDDAAGECFDKTGKLLGLAYPAGPIIDRLAAAGNPTAFEFPRPLMHEDHHDFSFSGLKTSVRYFVRDHPEVAEAGPALRDLCASVQAAIVEVLVTKTVRAARKLGVRCVTASGGVTCNRGLREQLAEACRRRGLELRLAAPALCTDNAAMVGMLAEHRLSRGCAGESLDADIAPNWSLS